MPLTSTLHFIVLGSGYYQKIAKNIDAMRACNSNSEIVVWTTREFAGQYQYPEMIKLRFIEEVAAGQYDSETEDVARFFGQNPTTVKFIITLIEKKLFSVVADFMTPYVLEYKGDSLHNFKLDCDMGGFAIEVNPDREFVAVNEGVLPDVVMRPGNQVAKYSPVCVGAKPGSILGSMGREYFKIISGHNPSVVFDNEMTKYFFAMNITGSWLGKCIAKSKITDDIIDKDLSMAVTLNHEAQKAWTDITGDSLYRAFYDPELGTNHSGVWEFPKVVQYLRSGAYTDAGETLLRCFIIHLYGRALSCAMEGAIPNENKNLFGISQRGVNFIPPEMIKLINEYARTILLKFVETQAPEDSASTDAASLGLVKDMLSAWEVPHTNVVALGDAEHTD